MRPKFRVLFLCTRNDDRSIFAEYFLRSMGGDRFEVYSGGETPSGEVNPLVLRILREAFKIDPTGALSRSWHTFTDIHFDFVITVCDDACERSPVFPGTPVTARLRRKWMGLSATTTPLHKPAAKAASFNGGSQRITCSCYNRGQS